MALLRKAFVMSVFPDQHAEYERRHNPIWPELQAVLKAHGVHNYSIYLEQEADYLFAYVELESEERWRQIAQTAVCQRWWAMMKPLMQTNEDNSPIALELKEVFHLD